MCQVFDDEEKDRLINILTNELKVLRAKVGVSQQEMADRLGVSRQTYGVIENKTQKMSWSQFLALLLLFKCNEETSKMLDWIGAYPQELEQFIRLQRSNENNCD